MNAQEIEELRKLKLDIAKLEVSNEELAQKLEVEKKERIEVCGREYRLEQQNDTYKKSIIAWGPKLLFTLSGSGACGTKETQTRLLLKSTLRMFLIASTVACSSAKFRSLCLDSPAGWSGVMAPLGT